MKTTVRDVKMAIAATALLAAMAQPSFGEDLKYKPIIVKTPDGLTISAQEWGNPAGPEILFIHGFSQSHLSWMRQVNSDLAKEFRIVTYDLRGHGNSDKPLDPASYKNSKAWGDEVQAVIDAAGLKHPVLVGWSYAGRVNRIIFRPMARARSPASTSSMLQSRPIPPSPATISRTCR